MRCDTARPKLHIHFSSGNAFFTTLYQNIVTWMHSFLLIFLWFKYHHVSNSNELWNNTRRYEILHTSNLGCSFNSVLPVSLDCPFFITPSSCVPYVTSLPGLSISDYPFVLCTLCCQFLWIVRFWLPFRLVYPMLPVSLDCPFLITPSSCVPYVASFYG